MLSDAVVLSSVVPAAATLLHTTASHEVLRMRLVADMTGHTRLVQLMVDIPEDAEAANVHRAACGARETSYGEQSRCAGSSMACEVVSRRAGLPEACT